MTNAKTQKNPKNSNAFSFLNKNWKCEIVLAACALCDADVVVTATKTTKNGTPIWSHVFDQGGHFYLKYNSLNMDLITNPNSGFLKERA